MEPTWKNLQVAGTSGAQMLLILAEWVAVGYRNPEFLGEMLALLPRTVRRSLTLDEFVRVSMAEAFYALSTDDTDGTIRTLEIVLRMDSELVDTYIRALAHLWIGRAYRGKAEYSIAYNHIVAARELVLTLSDSKCLMAVIQLQEGWLLFQRGASDEALSVFDEAESVLSGTDHWLARGNIESARSRIIRRSGDYVRSIEHSNRALELFEKSHPGHPNWARAVTNLAFVKRLLALQLKKRIDSFAARRGSSTTAKAAISKRLRPLHKQYQDLYRGAIAQLERAKKIYSSHEQQTGLGRASVVAGYLHLDVGDLELAEREANRALEIADRTANVTLKARALMLSGLIESANVDELLGHPEEAPSFARRAKEHCLQALALAQNTQDKRLIVNAHLALGEVTTNIYFNDYELAKQCVESASALIVANDADYVLDELTALQRKLKRTVEIDDTLRGWSQGIVFGKSLQEVTEEFSEFVVTQVWLREERKISRVAKVLTMSPKKVRRLLRHAESGELS